VLNTQYSILDIVFGADNINLGNAGQHTQFPGKFVNFRRIDKFDVIAVVEDAAVAAVMQIFP